MRAFCETKLQSCTWPLARLLACILLAAACFGIKSAAAQSCVPSSSCTATYAHQSAEVLDLQVSGIDRPIGTTAQHRFWSEDRRSFLPAAQLRAGEHLLTADGRLRTIASLTPRATPAPVYNLEVDGEHVYYVSSQNLLVHNMVCTVNKGIVGENKPIVGAEEVHNGPIEAPNAQKPTLPVKEPNLDLTDARGRMHILDGEGNGNGGHGPGRGISGKSEFPSTWSDQRVLNEISDIATDPNQIWSNPNSRGYITTTKTVEGIDIKVVYDIRNGRIVTGYPTNVPRNP